MQIHTKALAVLLLIGSLACSDTDVPAPEDVTDPTPTGGAATLDEATKPSFDYPGGWLDDHRCVDICGVTAESPVKRPNAVICFDPSDTGCAAKTGDGDFDYLLLSQHWIPSMCRGLAEGYDTTVTHQAGTVCTETAPNRLTLHGLWPNYTSGFPQCCGDALPLEPSDARGWSTELRQRLEVEQGDPTRPDFDDAICEIYNHEWQKHGTCFGQGQDVDPKAYFEAGLSLANRLAEATHTVDGWAGSTQSRADIEALYALPIQLLCDSHHPTDLLEIHTCWSRDHELLACPDTDGFGSLVRCGDAVTLPAWPR